jgi:hypothetical protein
VLGTRFHLTQGKIRDLLAQTLGLDFSVGAVSQAHGKVAAALKAPVAEAAASLVDAPVLHMDGKRSANPIFPVDLEPANLACIATTRMRSGFGSATAGGVLGAGGGLSGVGLEGRGLGCGQRG